MAEELKLEDFRPAYESDDQWGLRKKFLERHWGKYAKNRLICLSQIFINMEFFGCKYNDKVSEEVMELAGDLAAERRTQRATIIEKTFVKASDPDQPTPKKSKYGKGGAYSVDGRGGGTPKSPFAAPAPKRLGEELPEHSRPPKLLAKDKQLILIKAQLTIAPDSLRTALDELNFACNRAKVTWKLDYDDAARAAFVSVADVLVTRQFCPDKAGARAAGTRAAVSRLRSICLEVREEEYRDGRLKLGLFTSQDKRVGWDGPEDGVFSAQTETLHAVRTSLQEFQEGFKIDPVSAVEKSCEVSGTELEAVTTGKSGWTQDVELRIAGIALWSGKVQGKEKSEEAINRIRGVGEQLLKPHHRVYEDSDGRVVLMSSDNAITDDHIRGALTQGAKKT